MFHRCPLPTMIIPPYLISLYPHRVAMDQQFWNSANPPPPPCGLCLENSSQHLPTSLSHSPRLTHRCRLSPSRHLWMSRVCVLFRISSLCRIRISVLCSIFFFFRIQISVVFFIVSFLEVISPKATSWPGDVVVASDIVDCTCQCDRHVWHDKSCVHLSLPQNVSLILSHCLE